MKRICAEFFAIVFFRRTYFIKIFVMWSVLFPTNLSIALASSTPAEEAPLSSETVDIPTITSTEGNTFVIFPAGELYPYSIADPHRIGFGFQVQHFTQTSIPDSGDSRFYLKVGGTIGIVRAHPPNQPDQGWQLGVVCGFDAQFDIDNSQDNIGWDGNYGAILSMAPDSDWAYKIGMIHTSSHVGDEYIERTGRKRIKYTRHEVIIGASLAISEKWRVYTEGGWGYQIRREANMKPLRFQTGIEFVDKKRLFMDLSNWYAAVDVSAWEERDWRMDLSIQTGIEVPSGGRRIRIGVEYYDGRVPVGEFFEYDETSISLGAWMDL